DYYCLLYVGNGIDVF
nr:immunoglobulin light chain junction region [Macaca mulatta]MOW59100.1 immunoglobulin light chain junction region [Macaca mulatta]